MENKVEKEKGGSDTQEKNHTKEVSCLLLLVYDCFPYHSIQSKHKKHKTLHVLGLFGYNSTHYSQVTCCALGFPSLNDPSCYECLLVILNRSWCHAFGPLSSSGYKYFAFHAWFTLAEFVV